MKTDTQPIAVDTAHTPAARRIAEILIPEGVDRKGHPTRIQTAYGAKNRIGIADLIDSQTGAAEMLAALELCAAKLAMWPEGSNPEFFPSLKAARAAIHKATIRA